jgi:repressor LexA
MGKDLHSVQKRLLDALRENLDAPLTIRGLQELLGLSSTSLVIHHLRQLEKRGYLKRNPFNSRDYQVITDGPERQFTYLNLYGLARCGPQGTILDDNPIDRVAVPSRLLSFRADEAFLVQAKGDSMTPRINDGDLVVARRTSTVDSGAVVVCVNGGEALIKKLHLHGDQWILISNNSAYEPLLASPEDFRVVGEVRAIMSQRVR